MSAVFLSSETIRSRRLLMKTLSVLLLAVVLLTMASVVAAQGEDTPQCAPGCTFQLKQEWTDNDTESYYDPGVCRVCMVQIKSATQVFSLYAPGCVDGYCVEQVDQSAAWRAFENSTRHDISNVSWWADCTPTAVTLSESWSEMTPPAGVALIFLALSVIGLLVIGAIAIARTVRDREAQYHEMLERHVEMRRRVDKIPSVEER